MFTASSTLLESEYNFHNYIGEGARGDWVISVFCKREQIRKIGLVSKGEPSTNKDRTKACNNYFLCTDDLSSSSLLRKIRI